MPRVSGQHLTDLNHYWDRVHEEADLTDVRLHGELESGFVPFDPRQLLEDIDHPEPPAAELEREPDPEELRESAEQLGARIVEQLKISRVKKPHLALSSFEIAQTMTPPLGHPRISSVLSQLVEQGLLARQVIKKRGEAHWRYWLAEKPEEPPDDSMPLSHQVIRFLETIDRPMTARQSSHGVRGRDQYDTGFASALSQLSAQDRVQRKQMRRGPTEMCHYWPAGRDWPET